MESAFFELIFIEFNLSGMTEAQAFGVLSDFLTVLAERKFGSVAETAS